MKNILASFLIVLAFVLAVALVPLVLSRGAATASALWSDLSGEMTTAR